MSWDYRVVFKDSVFAIHEVYYDENGNIETWTENPVEPMGETLEELKKDLDFYQSALSKPVLYFEGQLLGLLEKQVKD